MDASKKIVATWILVFDFELFVGGCFYFWQRVENRIKCYSHVVNIEL